MSIRTLEKSQRSRHCRGNIACSVYFPRAILHDEWKVNKFKEWTKHVLLMFNSKYCYLVAFFPRTILNDVWKVNQCKASTKPEMFVLKNRYLERMQIMIGTMPKPQSSIASIFKRRPTKCFVSVAIKFNKVKSILRLLTDFYDQNGQTEAKCWEVPHVLIVDDKHSIPRSCWPFFFTICQGQGRGPTQHSDSTGHPTQWLNSPKSAS